MRISDWSSDVCSSDLQVSPYPHRIGGHCGSGALRDLLEWAGLGWDGPPSEGLVFALGGALGLSYVRSVGLFPPLYLVGRGGELELDLPRRLGAAAEQRVTDDPAEGWSWVRAEHAGGGQVMPLARSVERSEGKECVSTGKAWWVALHYKKQ